MIAGLRDFHQKASFNYELIVVDDGSTDKTVELIQTNDLIKELESSGKFKMVRLPFNKGKGAALKAGVEAATGTHILTLDADMATKPTEVLRWMAENNQAMPENEIWIASREHEDSKVTEVAARRRTGRVFNFLVRLITPLRLHDTQCGFKLYPASVAKELFREQKSTGWAHDVELLYRAQLNDVAIKALPVTWETQDGSKISPTKDALPMLMNVIGVSLRLKWEYFVTTPLRLISGKTSVENEKKREAIFRMLFFVS
jgi:dolichyl-phosphate beta-glucosyltransferase